MKYVILVALLLLVLLEYALMVAAHDADERAEKMARKWAEEHSKRVNEIVDNLKADVISVDKILVKESGDERKQKISDR